MKQSFVIAGFLLVSVVLFALVALFATTTPVDDKGAAAIISLVGVAAVGIERVIEAFWTLIGMIAGFWTPFAGFKEQLDDLVRGLDAELTRFYAQAKDAVARAGSDADEAGRLLEQIEQIEQQTRAPRQRLIQRLGAAPQKQEIHYVAISALNSIDAAQRIIPAGIASTQVAVQAANALDTFLETFKDNPGRRFVSICMGTLLGMPFAWLFSLDLIQAVLQTPVHPSVAAILPGLGVAVTGLLIGLGANPTHEAIRILEEYKKYRKDLNYDQIPLAEQGSADGRDERAASRPRGRNELFVAERRVERS